MTRATNAIRAASRPRVALLSLGGTIASSSVDDSSGVSPTLSPDELAATVPGLSEWADIETRAVRQMPSASFRFGDVIDVARAIGQFFDRGFDAAVVTQGTDNIEETSFLLDLLIDDERPVIVTGAMRHPALPGADGPANLYASVVVATSPAARGLGTLVVMNDEVHAARFVQKSHASSPSTFHSPQCGPLGVVVEGRAHVFTRVTPVAMGMTEGEVPPVALVRCALGDDGRVVRSLSALGYRGLVVEGLGGGHVPSAMVPLLEEATRTMPVVLASRTGSGVVLANTYGFEGSEIDLLQRGLRSAGVLDGLKARIVLSLALAATSTLDHAARRFSDVVSSLDP